MKAKDIGVGISKFLKLLPYSIATLPYDYGVEIVKAYFSHFDLEIWSRNGHALKTLTPGASDLDLTVFSKSIDDKRYQDFIRLYSKLKYFLPFLGEVNWIENDEVESFKIYLNPLEAQRDPILREHLNFNRHATFEEKICFFLRCLASDTYGIRTDFSSRRRKWNRHLLDLGFSEYCNKFDTPSEIFEFCEERLLVSNLPSYQKGFLGKQIQNHYQDINAWNRFYSTAPVRDFLMLAPNRWLGATLHHGKMEEDLSLIQNFSLTERNLLKAQIEWEIWGLFTQYHQIKDKQGLIRHMENFNLLARELSDFPELSEGFKKLITIQS